MFNLIQRIINKKIYLMATYLCLTSFSSFAVQLETTSLLESPEFAYYNNDLFWLLDGIYQNGGAKQHSVAPIKSLVQLESECASRVGTLIEDYIPNNSYFPSQLGDIYRTNFPLHSYVYSVVLTSAPFQPIDDSPIRFSACFIYLSDELLPDACSAEGRVWDGTQCALLPSTTEPEDLVNLGECEHLTCRPINIATGNKFFIQTDFIGAGINPLRLDLYYNSHGGVNSWTGEYRQRLEITSDAITVIRSNGQRIEFTVDNNAIVPPSQVFERLILDADTGIYHLTLEDNTLERYSSSGQLLSMRYSGGLTHTLSYTEDTITVTRRDESLVLTLTENQVTSAKLPDDTIINYHYDSVDGISRLLQITYADTHTQTYFYEDTNFPTYITGIEDGNGFRIASIQYDTQGRAISSEGGFLNSGIERTQIQYHDDGRRTLTNSLGKQNIYHFTEFNGEYKMTQVEGVESANCAAANQAYTYDSSGFMASKTDWKGNVTTYINNDRGLEESRIEASGTPEARTIHTEWHPTFNLRTKVTEPARETIFTYDINGRLISQEVSSL